MTLPPLEIQITREQYMMQRQALLMYIDAIEKILDIHPRTSELRKQARDERDREKVRKDSDN